MALEGNKCTFPKMVSFRSHYPKTLGHLMQLHNVVILIASASLVLWMCSVRGIRNTALCKLHKVSKGFKADGFKWQLA